MVVSVSVVSVVCCGSGECEASSMTIIPESPLSMQTAIVSRMVASRLIMGSIHIWEYFAFRTSEIGTCHKCGHKLL